MDNENNSEMERQPRRKRIGKSRFHKTLIRALVYGLAALLLLILVGFAVLRIPYIQDRIKTMAVVALERQLGVQLEWEALSGNIFSHLVIDRVRLGDSNGTILSADRLSVRYQLPMLLKRTVAISRLHFVGLQINLARNPAGKWNIVELFRPMGPTAGQPPESPSGTPFRVLIKGLSVTAGTINISDSGAQPPEVRRFDEIALDIAIKAGQTVQADIRNIAFRLDRPRLTLVSLNGKVRYNMVDESLTIDGMRIETKRSRLSVKAHWLQGKPESEIDLNVAIAALSVSELQRLLSLPPMERGNIEGNIHLQGSPGRLHHRLKLGLGGQSLTAEGILTGANGTDMGLETRGELRRLNPATWPLDGTVGLNGDINADFSLTATSLDLPERQGRLNVNLKGSGLSGYRVDGGTLDLTVGNGALILSQADLSGPNGNVSIEGRLAGINEPAAGLNAVITAELRNLDTDALFPGPKLGGRLNLDLKTNAAGRYDASKSFDFYSWTGNADLHLHSSIILATEVMGGKLLADWNGKSLQVKAFEIQSEVGKASLQGRATVQPLVYTVGGRIVIDKLKQTLSLLGRRLPRIPEEKLPDGRLELNGAWDGKSLRLETLDLQSTVGHAVLKAHVSPEPLDYRIDGEITVPELKKIVPLAAELLPEIPVEQIPDGHFQVSGNVKGSHAATDIRATLNVENLAHDDVTIASARLTGDWQFSGDRIVGRTEGILQDIAYQSNLFPRLDLTLSLNPQALTAAINLSKDTGEKLQLAGQMSPWRQDDRYVRIDTLRVTDIGAPLNRLIPEFSNADPIQLRTHRDGIAVEDLHLVSGEISLRAAGNLALRGAQQLTLSLNGVGLEPLSTLWQDEPTVKGLLAAEVELAGTAESPIIDALITVSGARGYEVSLSDVNLRARYHEKTASLTLEGLRNGRKLFDLEGRSGMTLRLLPFVWTPQPGSLKAQLVAENLKLSELPIPQRRDVKADGRVNVRLQATGNIQQPQITGFFTLDKGSLELPPHNLTYESVQAELRLLPGKLTIDKMEVSGDREGKLSLTGDILLAGWKPSSLNLHLTGQKAPIAWRREITARIDPDISLSGKFSALVLSGRLRIPEGRINLDRMMAGGPADIQVLGERSAEDQTIVISQRREGFLSSLSADLTIDVPRNVWLRGQDLNAEIAGTIKLSKKPQGPFLLIGTLKTIRGNYLFQSRRFEITRGNVEFQGLEDPDPVLDIRAESKIRDITIIVRITGSARMIELSLESEPMMDQADIISYLVFGRPTNELRSEQATDAQAAALNFAGQAAARELKNILGETLAVDEIRIDPGEEDWRSGSLTLGKYVSRNIFMTYRMGFSSSSFGSVGIEYELNRNFSVEAEIGDDQSSGVDLIWKKDF